MARLAVSCLLAVAALGCLRVFGPDLRATGVHAGVAPRVERETCMGCHEAEADALVRMKAGDHAPAAAPLVADWMLAESRTCTDCHAIRGAGAR